MTLADSIRKGAQQRPWCQRTWFWGLSTGSEIKSCALGAAYEGTFGTPDFQRWGADVMSEEMAMCELSGVYPELQRESSCPACSSLTCLTLESVIWHLNDQHGWTREQIADWLDAR